ncbi:TPA: hypothetical protein ACQTYG_006028 [Pseudomonas aeruginosa]|uniref:hypothetical protein n=1 Tax=Pseudomonas aeruginosa TaxID=287 RepID=UPI0015B80CB3|nr:hypothetical protein [Pseudomonas aeruginosa]MDS9918429.1 hypothetical protein [Pseudomonas aeruginosa]
MKKSVTIIDAGPTHMSVKALIVSAELKRRGVRFLPRLALKRAHRSATKAVAVNPFALS